MAALPNGCRALTLEEFAKRVGDRVAAECNLESVEATNVVLLGLEFVTPQRTTKMMIRMPQVVGGRSNRLERLRVCVCAVEPVVADVVEKFRAEDAPAETAQPGENGSQ